MTLNDLSIEVLHRIPPYSRLILKLSPTVTKMVITLTFKVIEEALLNGEFVTIRGFGSFHPRFYESQKSWSQKKRAMIDSRPWMKINFRMGSNLLKKSKERAVERSLRREE